MGEDVRAANERTEERIAAAKREAAARIAERENQEGGALSRAEASSIQRVLVDRAVQRQKQAQAE